MPEKTEAQKRAQKRYMGKLARVEITMTPEKQQRLRDHAEARGESVNGFVNRAIDEAMEREMTAEEAIAKYTERFGGYPAFLLMGASDEEIVAALTACIESGQELQPDHLDAEY